MESKNIHRTIYEAHTILKYDTDKSVAVGCISLKTAKICSTMVQDHQSVGEKVLLNNNNALRHLIFSIRVKMHISQTSGLDITDSLWLKCFCVNITSTDKNTAIIFDIENSFLGGLFFKCDLSSCSIKPGRVFYIRHYFRFLLPTTYSQFNEFLTSLEPLP